MNRPSDEERPGSPRTQDTMPSQDTPQQRDHCPPEDERPQAPKDLRASGFPKLYWSAAQRTESLDRLRAWARWRSDEASDWYERKKVWPRRWAWLIRFLGVLGLAIAALLPMLLEAIKCDISPLWVSISLGIAGASLMFDRYLGHSRAWIRFVSAATQIKALKTAFDLDWERRVSGPPAETEDPPPLDLVAELIDRAADFVHAVDDVVHEETAEWANAFQEAMEQLQTRAPASPRSPGEHER